MRIVGGVPACVRTPPNMRVGLCNHLAMWWVTPPLPLACSHPNLVSFLGLCTLPPCILTEYCSFGSLYSVLHEGVVSPLAAARLTWKRRLEIALDAARGLAYLHLSSPPIIHRDVRCAN